MRHTTGYKQALEVARVTASRNGMMHFVIVTSMGMAQPSKVPLIGPACDLPSTNVYPDGRVEHNAYWRHAREGETPDLIVQAHFGIPPYRLVCERKSVE